MPAIIGSCFGTAYPRIAPGYALSVHQYVVLLGPGFRGSGPTGKFETKPAVVSLMPGRSPTAFVSERGGIHPVVPRPPGARGPLYFTGWSSCLEHEAPYSEIDRGWTPSSSGVAVPRFHSPDCKRIVEWHAFAGYLNQPVANINYKSS